MDDEEERLRTTASIEDIVKCCSHFSNEYIGALIVLERNTKIEMSSILEHKWIQQYPMNF